MSPLDWLAVAVLVLSTLRGLLRGLILTLAGLLGLLAGLAAASWYSPVLAGWLHRWIPSLWEAEVFSFLALLLAVILIAHLIGRALRGGVRTIGLGWADRFFGGVFGLLRGVVFLAIVFGMLSMVFPGNSWVRTSRMAPVAAAVAQQLNRFVPAAPLRHARDRARQLGSNQWQ